MVLVALWRCCGHIMMLQWIVVVVLVLVHTVSCQTVVDCDVVVAGGSTASLATALSAAEAALAAPGGNETIICYTEITDWVGGQMSAGGVPAIDFGGLNRNTANQPASFVDFFNFFPGNPGACWVSTKCYLPNVFVEEWAMPRLQKLPNLRLFLRTTIVNTTRDASGRISSLRAVQRTPRDRNEEWTKNLSEELEDWYSEEDSSMFTKEVLELRGSVFVEATELGDVLATGDFRWLQGVESPTEESWTTQSTCGQAWTLTFYLERLAAPSPDHKPIPPGNPAGGEVPDPSSFEWQRFWTYRRSHCAGNTSLEATNVGDISQQNYDNDLDTAYLLVDSTTGRSQRPWRGGVNMTALKMLEDRAYWYATYMVKNRPSSSWTIDLNYTTAGTKHGLSKFPYLRDTRRGVGPGDWRLPYPPADYYNASQPSIGEMWPDRVALTDYNADFHHMTSCVYPPYINQTMVHATKPTSIPLRSLLHVDSPNLLLAGKTMALTAKGNTYTRLHPSEWTSGVAAGGIAIFYLHNHFKNTSQLLGSVSAIQDYLHTSVLEQPLDWANVPPPPPPSIGYVCALGNHCFGVDKEESGYPVTKECPSDCTPLSSNMWLANMDYWTENGDGKITSKQATILKKATTESANLPPDQKKSVPEGYTCTLVSEELYPEGYKLCSV